MSTSRFAILSAAVATLAFDPGAALGQSPTPPWPQRQVRFIVPTPPGSPGDVILRLIQPRLQETWGQSVVVENRSGAGGNIAMQEVLRAGDSHTVFAGPDTVLTINPYLYKKLSFSYENDVVPVTYLAAFSQMLVCNPAVGAGNVAALVKASRAQPIAYASSGAGTPSHMAMEMFLHATGARMTHVPYRGPAPAAQDIVGGQVQCGFLASSVVLPFVKQNRLTALGVSGAARTPQAPNVPTISEEVAPGFNATFHESLQMPRDTPRAVIDKLQRDVARALQAPEVQGRLREMDLVPQGTSAAEAEKQVKEDRVKWGRIATGLQLVLD